LGLRPRRVARRRSDYRCGSAFARTAMMNPISAIKFIGCWFCIIASGVLLVLGHGPPALPGVLALLAIAFAQAPATW
jgi:hypothetical protein